MSRACKSGRSIGRQEPGHASYGHSRFNATKHGLSGRSALLPWEDAGKLEALLDELVEEHQPRGPTERHLVGEIAAVMWRQRRVLQAEVAEIRDELREQFDDWRDKRTVAAALAHIGPRGEAHVATAVQKTGDQVRAELGDIDEDEGMIRKALRILHRAGPHAYENAVAALREDSREWWQETLEDGPDDDEEEGKAPYEPTAASLRAFIEAELLPSLASQRTEIANRAIVREHAFAAAVARANLDRLGRYETHLDRKLNRLLGTLLRLQEARRTINGVAEPSVSQKTGAEKRLPRASSEPDRRREAQDVAA